MSDAEALRTFSSERRSQQESVVNIKRVAADYPDYDMAKGHRANVQVKAQQLRWGLTARHLVPVPPGDRVWQPHGCIN